jgi:CBS domain-containing protein
MGRDFIIGNVPGRHRDVVFLGLINHLAGYLCLPGLFWQVIQNVLIHLPPQDSENDMQVKDCMKRNIVFVTPKMTIAEAARLLAEKHIGSLPVVDSAGKLVGVLTLRSLLLMVMPDFVHLVEDFGFVADFGAAEERKPDPEMLARPVSEIMLVPEAVEETSGLMRAYALLHQHQLHDLTVVDAQGKLVGIVSRVDVGAAFLSGWNVTQGGGHAGR